MTAQSGKIWAYATSRCKTSTLSGLIWPEVLSILCLLLVRLGKFIVSLTFTSSLRPSSSCLPVSYQEPANSTCQVALHCRFIAEAGGRSQSQMQSIYFAGRCWHSTSNNRSCIVSTVKLYVVLKAPSPCSTLLCIVHMDSIVQVCVRKFACRS